MFRAKYCIQVDPNTAALPFIVRKRDMFFWWKFIDRCHTLKEAKSVIRSHVTTMYYDKNGIYINHNKS